MVNSFPTRALRLRQHRPTEITLAKALAGTQLELPCLVDQNNCGDVYYITWTRQSAAQSVAQQWSRVYLFTGSTDSSPHKQFGDLLNRSTFHMPQQQPSSSWSSSVAKLVIDDTKLTDEALYKCDVTYVKGKCPSISLVRAQVMLLPDKARIYNLVSLTQDNYLDQSSVPLPLQQANTQPFTKITLSDNQIIGPLNENDQLRLICSVSGGRPAPRGLTWRKYDSDGRLVNLASQSVSTGQAAVETQLNHTLTRADLGAKFQCHVEHEALQQTPAARIVMPPQVRVPAQYPAPHGARRLDGGDDDTADAMLDLHPSIGVSREITSDDIVDGANSIGSMAAATTRGPSSTLDTQIGIELNGELIDHCHLSVLM